MKWVEIKDNFYFCLNPNKKEPSLQLRQLVTNTHFEIINFSAVLKDTCI